MAASTCSFAASLSYADIAETVVSHVEGARFALVERVAEEVAELLLARFNSPWVRIKLSKPGAVARAANALRYLMMSVMPKLSTMLTTRLTPNSW